MYILLSIDKTLCFFPRKQWFNARIKRKKEDFVKKTLPVTFKHPCFFSFSPSPSSHLILIQFNVASLDPPLGPPTHAFGSQRPQHVGHTRSRPIPEVKQHCARSVTGWVTACEPLVLLAIGCVGKVLNLGNLGTFSIHFKLFLSTMDCYVSTLNTLATLNTLSTLTYLSQILRIQSRY